MKTHKNYSGSNQFRLKRKGLSFKTRIKIILLMIVFTGLAYGYHEFEQWYFAPQYMLNPYVMPENIRPVTASERRDTTSAVINHYFAKVNSPLYGLGQVFYDEAVSNGLPVYLLPSVACAESSCGKNYIKSTSNFFGWGRGKIVFKDKVDAIKVVAMKLGSMAHYKDFRESKEIGQFCISYNAPEASTYCKTIRNFMKEIQAVEFDL